MSPNVTYQVPVELASAFDALLTLATSAVTSQEMTDDERRIVELIQTNKLKSAPRTDADFETWWSLNGINTTLATIGLAFREIALKAWTAAPR